MFIWAHKSSREISSLGQFSRLKTDIVEVELFLSADNTVSKPSTWQGSSGIGPNVVGPSHYPKSNSTGVGHDQKDTSRLGPTSQLVQSPSSLGKLFNLKIHWFFQVVWGHLSASIFVATISCTIFLKLWWKLPSIWANKSSWKISRIGQFSRLKTDILEMQLFHSTDNSK